MYWQKFSKFRIRLIISAIGGFGIGIFATTLWPLMSDELSENPQISTMQIERVISEQMPEHFNVLKRMLATEKQERLKLEQRLIDLASQVARLRPANNPSSPITANPTVNDNNSALPIERGASSTADPDENSTNLSAYGFSPNKIQQIRSLEDKQELAELILRDKAQRESWDGSQRFTEELANIQKNTPTVRNALNADEYDRYLYAMGRHNRVGVDRVIQDSAAANIGLLQGDQIVSYDGERIYSWQDLRTATSSGTLNQHVQIVVLRKNQSLSFDVQRGPLGIMMFPQRVDPTNL